MSCSALTREGKECGNKQDLLGCCSKHLKSEIMKNIKGVSLEDVVVAKDGKHKYVAIFNDNGKERRVSFGASGYQDYILSGGNNEMRERYRTRHVKDLDTLDPTKPGYLSMWILWNKKSLEESIRDYKKTFNL